MSAPVVVADRIAGVMERIVGGPPQIRIRGWDGSETGPDGAPTMIIRSRRAIRRLLWQPNEIGLARAYVSGELDIEGDIYAALTGIAALLDSGGRPALGPGDRGELMRAAIVLGAVGPQPKPPPEEVALHGRLHSRIRDRAAISHHYDVGNDFYRIVLGPSLVYSCAYWADPDGTLETAQTAKLELICRKLGLRPGMRLLDVGCGWGSMAIHAAQHYGARVVGVTLSREQAELARKRVVEAGLAEQVEIRLQDYRDVGDGPFDAISSIGMAEHVGPDRFVRYGRTLYRLLEPGGRLLNHQIARRPGPRRTAPTFISSYVFPDGELSPVGSTVSALEEAGFEVRDVESLRDHYALTLRQWVRNLTGQWDEAVRLAGEGRARVWKLYMAGSALAFEAGRIGVNQVLAVRAHPDGRSGLPPTRTTWLGV